MTENDQSQPIMPDLRIPDTRRSPRVACREVNRSRIYCFTTDFLVNSESRRLKGGAATFADFVDVETSDKRTLARSLCQCCLQRLDNTGIPPSMKIALTPLAGESEPNDPAYAGEWASMFADIKADNPPWCCYFARLGSQPVGVGMFKGPPTDGVVEIAYLTFLGARRRGVATAIAKQLISIALANGIARVVAHTLRENSPSTEVLQSNGFAGPTEVIDPDDGPVWRWDLLGQPRANS